MLLAFSSWLSSIPNITHAMHFLSPSSPAEFSALSPMFSPTPEYAERKLPPPRSRFDVAIANLVVHHVDDLDGFMRGVVGSLAEGGWVVFTEFGKVEGGVDMASQHREEMQKATVSHKLRRDGLPDGHLPPRHRRRTSTAQSTAQVIFALLSRQRVLARCFRIVGWWTCLRRSEGRCLFSCQSRRA